MALLKVKAQSILDEKEQKIIPENIKEGVEIFDVTGTYTGGGSEYNAKVSTTFTENNGRIMKVIIELPALDTSSVIQMDSMFSDCSNLISVPQMDTSNVISMNGMFSSCSSLTTIPLLNTAKVTNMSYMFKDCTSITTIPQLVTGSVTNMSGMFQGCGRLTAVPQLDTSNVTNMYYMFQNCNNLRDGASLINILQMCINATKVSGNKTLRAIGLDQQQAMMCQGMPNYSAFTNAGWTTGY